MKLQRYNQFVKKLNEEREMSKYDSLEDFRKAMDADESDSDVITKEPLDVPKDDFSRYDDMDMPEDDMDMPEDDDMDMPEEDMDMPEDDMDMPEDDMDMPEETISDERKLHDLAKMLNTEVENNQITYGDEVVNYYSETGNLHIGSKEFETAEDAAEYLKGGEPRMVRDTNESKSYKFKRKRRF